LSLKFGICCKEAQRYSKDISMSVRILIFLLLSSSALNAYADQDHQLWTLIKKNIELKDFDMSLQGQWRFSDEESGLAEEQINVSLLKNINKLNYAFIYTLGTIEAYEKVREHRFAIQVEKKINLKKSSYQVRLRQEARNFTIINNWAHRFRIRNRFNWDLKNKYFNQLSLSSEFNFYLNSFLEDEKGLSSHRSILSLSKKINKKTWIISYIHDLQIVESPNFTRNVLFLGLHF